MTRNLSVKSHSSSILGGATGTPDTDTNEITLFVVINDN